jgi:hypothetical protein
LTQLPGKTQKIHPEKRPKSKSPIMEIKDIIAFASTPFLQKMVSNKILSNYDTLSEKLKSKIFTTMNAVI